MPSEACEYGFGAPDGSEDDEEQEGSSQPTSGITGGTRDDTGDGLAVLVALGILGGIVVLYYIIPQPYFAFLLMGGMFWFLYACLKAEAGKPRDPRGPI